MTFAVGGCMSVVMISKGNRAATITMSATTTNTFKLLEFTLHNVNS